MVDEHNTGIAPECNPRAHVVKAEWFWASVQNEEAQDEKDYLYKDVSIANELFIFISILSVVNQAILKFSSS